MKLNRNKGIEDSSSYLENIERRNQDVPSTSFLPGSAKNGAAIIAFSDCEDLVKIIKVAKEPLPASIEYLSSEKKVGSRKFDVFEDEEAEKTFLTTGSKITQKLKQSFATDLEHPEGFQFDRPDWQLKTLTHQPEIPTEELLDAEMASEEKINELTKLHMGLYSVLSRVHEVRIAQDLRDAYDIQDRIAYVLDNRSLLYKDLVDNLINYLADVVDQLSQYEKEIRLRQIKFNDLNSRVSKLKEYKYKTDPSFQLIEHNQELAKEEIERNLKILEDGKSA